MDSDDWSRDANYLYDDLLQQDSFVSPVQTDSENSVDIYDGLDTDSQGGGQSASRVGVEKDKHAKDCFDLYEEILTEERTAKEISLKEFQEKSVARERKLEDLLQKLQEIQVQNSTLSNENIQLKKNISALLKTARLEIVRKDEEINRLNKRQSINWIGNQGIRRHHNLSHHPPGSFNVPPTDNKYPSHSLPCPPRPVNVEHRLLTARLNKEGNCFPDGPLTGANRILEPKRQCDLQKRAPLSLSSPRPPLYGEPSSKSSPHPVNAPPHRQNVLMDKTELFPFEERRVEKINGEHFVRGESAEKLEGSTTERSSPGNKNRELSFPEKIDKVEKTSQSTKPHPKVRGTGRHTPEKSDKIRHRFSQDALITPSKDSPATRDKRSHAEREERHKEKDTRRSDSRGRELKMDRKKDQKSNREDGKDKQRDDKLRSQPAEKEREPERWRFEKNREPSQLTSPASPRKSSRKNTCPAVEHTARERRERKIESKNSGKERSTEDSRDRRTKHSNRKMPNEIAKDSGKQSGKNVDRNLKKDGSKKEEKGKSEYKARKDHSTGRHSSRDGGNCAKRNKHRGEKAKTRLSESHERMTERHCADETQKRAEQSVHGNSTANLPTPTDEQNSIIRDTDPKLQFMETLQLTISPVKRPSTVLFEMDVQMQYSELLSEDEVVGFVERTASAVEEPDFNFKRSCNKADPAQAMDTNCESTESPTGESEVHVPPGNQEPAELEMVPSAQLKGVDAEEGFQVMSVEDAPPQAMECDSTANDPEKLTQIVVETMGTVEVISEAVCEVTESSVPLVEIDGTDTEEQHTEPVGGPSEIHDESVGEVNEKSQQLAEADYITIDGQDGSSDCPIETDSTVNNEKVVSPHADGKPEDSDQCVNASVAAVEEWIGNSEPDFSDCELPQTNGSVVDSSTVTKTPVKNVCIPDDQEDNSIQSIDFTYIGCIPEPISPLTSPLRPVRPSTLERSGTPAERDVDHKDSAVKVQAGCSPRSCTLELNKENQEPLCKAGGKTLGISVEPFLEEIEEGEIVSDEEECAPQVQNVQVTKGSNSKEKSNPGKSTHKKETRLVNADEPALACPSEALTKIKGVKKQGKSEGVALDQIAEGLRLSSPSSVERNQIKSSVSDLMEALMVARKTVRQKYMKLHKQFEIHRFQRIIEIAFADFTSVVKRSHFPKSRRQLKTSICAVIENVLSQVKCNGIVSSIFSQQAPNMKEKLWMFVEKQLDFMFDKTRETFISCESISLELALEEKRKNEKIIKKRKKNTVIKHLENKVDKIPKLKRSLIASEPCLANNLSGKKNSGKNKPASDDSKLKRTKILNKYSKNCTQFSAGGISKTVSRPCTKAKNVPSITLVSSNASSDAPVNSSTAKDSHEKTELGILTEQQASTLTFNLVSDAQMGEIFKCLLQGSDLLESNSWPIPEKERPHIGSQLSGIASTLEKAPPVSQVDTISWHPVTPNKHRTVGLRPPLNLDILDESCMLEIPDKMAQTNNSMISPPEDSNSQRVIESSSVLQMRSSVSSILMEDLAVSLTVPSPLKSDGQISFLTSQNGESLRDGVSEAILSAHYSENAVLEEEDASEQDIHLALDSDNSSSRSSSSSTWNKQISASDFRYQHHPPMQAVVMEKSNDHFIVKIRCRPPDAEATLSSPAAAVRESQASELGPSDNHYLETVDEETVASCSSVDVALGDHDCAVSELLPNHCLIAEHPVDDGKNMEASGMGVNVKLPHSEEDQPSATENHTDLELSLETPSDVAENVVLLTAQTCTATVSEHGSRSSNRKRKSNVKADSTVKRARKEDELLKSTKRKGKETKGKRSSLSSAKKALSKTVVTPEKTVDNSSQPTVPSPTSLPAKNVIKKNGEVVVTWTREDDRAILLDCQQKGANEKTFTYISGKLQRSPRQVSERFHRLMKLFKKSENMNN